MRSSNYHVLGTTNVLVQGNGDAVGINVVHPPSSTKTSFIDTAIVVDGATGAIVSVSAPVTTGPKPPVTGEAGRRGWVGGWAREQVVEGPRDEGGGRAGAPLDPRAATPHRRPPCRPPPLTMQSRKLSPAPPLSPCRRP